MRLGTSRILKKIILNRLNSKNNGDKFLANSERPVTTSQVLKCVLKICKDPSDQKIQNILDDLEKLRIYSKYTNGFLVWRVF